MNKNRRAALYDAACQLDEVMEAIREVQNEEQEAYDNLPEGFQNSSRGEAMLDAIDTMDEFISDIEEIQKDIQDFTR